MSYAAGRDRVARTHQALSEVSRVRLLELLQASTGGMSAADAAAEVGLHLATVRTHLETLVEAGLARRVSEERTTRGRPRIIYQAAPDAADSGGDGYRLLAEMLASLIEDSMRDPGGKAELAGAAWGRSLVERAKPMARLPRAEALRRVEALLRDLGFEPETPAAPRDTILLHRCPFREVAIDHKEVACSAHLGLIKGALDELGVAADRASLEPFVTPNLCVAHLGRARR